MIAATRILLGLYLLAIPAALLALLALYAPHVLAALVGAAALMGLVWLNVQHWRDPLTRDEIRDYFQW